MSRSLHIDVCPAWFAWAIDNPVRRWLHKPEEILGQLIVPGFTVVDLGCGSGPFTIALAQMVGSSGRVIAADVQPAMLTQVQRRVAQAGVQDRVELHLCGREHIGLLARVDFVLAFWMVHEVPNPLALFAEIHEALNPNGKLLLVEPKLHVGRGDFEKEVGAALEANFELVSRPSVRLSLPQFSRSDRQCHSTSRATLTRTLQQIRHSTFAFELVFESLGMVEALRFGRRNVSSAGFPNPHLLGVRCPDLFLITRGADRDGVAVKTE